MAKDLFWRTSGSYVYVDSNIGDDINGLGTAQSPYQTLGKAWRTTNTKPSTIVCRGFFQEDMADGNHACTIRGDYPGAAVFDGDNQYTLYGFTVTNLIINNCLPGNVGMSVYTNSPLYAGVGRADIANYVGNTAAIHLVGLAGSWAIVGNSGHYFGIVGGAGSYNGTFYPKRNDTYGLFIFGYNNPTNWSIVGVKKEDRIANRQPTGGPNGFVRSIFADVAFYIGDHLTFNGCYFGSDCTWWDGKTGEQIILEGNTSEEKIAFLESKIAELGTASSNCTFKDCVFLDLTAEEIFNNPTKGDLTTKLSANIPATVGVLPPSLNIPIIPEEELTNTVKATWDPGTATEYIDISDEGISLNEEFYLLEKNSIETGVIEIDPSKVSINALYSAIASHFSQGALVNDKKVMGEDYNSGDTLPIGKYLVKGNVVYDYTTYFEGDIITVTKDSTTFEKDGEYEGDVKLTAIDDMDLKVVAFVRIFPGILEILGTNTSHNLDEGKCYLVMDASTNISLSSGRKLYQGSIIDAKEGETITSDEPIRLGVLNNILYPEYVPVQNFGELFISRKGTTLDRDSDGNVLTSANDNSYKANNQGGNLNDISKIGIEYKYSQFKIIVTTC